MFQQEKVLKEKGHHVPHWGDAIVGTTRGQKVRIHYRIHGTGNQKVMFVMGTFLDSLRDERERNPFSKLLFEESVCVFFSY